MEPDPLVFEEMPFRLRDYQQEWADKIEEDRHTSSRLLVDAPGGCGKSSLFAALAHREWTWRNKRTLVLENRDKLVWQTADRLAKETGLDVDIEMGQHHASPYAPITVMSVQTGSRLNRLTGFADDHFGLVVPDECHYSLAVGWQRVLKYFHYGSASLAEDWARPEDGTYAPKAIVVGTTATPDIGKKRNLGEFFQKFSVRYSYLDAVRDGWLVGPIARRRPLPNCDLRKLRPGTTANGRDLKPEEVSALMVPIVGDLADQIVRFASDRKTIAFTPSVECARLLAEACIKRGLRAVFVSGECLDVDEKTAAFEAMGKGSVMANCSLFCAGYDHPPIDCVAWFRPTMSRAFLLQGLYRGTRVLPDLVSDDMTAGERVAAIAASPKRDMLVIDPLWRTEDIPLCSFFDLYTDKPEVRAKLEALPEGADVTKAVVKAERDWEEALRRAALKRSKREEQTVDPLVWAATLGEERIAHYVPENSRDAGPMEAGQIEYLDRNRIDRSAIGCYGQAAEIINTHLFRWTNRLATPTQLDFMRRLGLDARKFTSVTQEQAGAIIGSRRRELAARR